MMKKMLKTIAYISVMTSCIVKTNIFEDAWNSVKSTAEDVGNWTKKTSEQAWDTVKGAAVDVKNKTEDIAHDAARVAESAARDVKKAAEATAAEIKKTAESIVVDVKNKAEMVASDVKDAAEDALGFAKKAGDAALQGFKYVGNVVDNGIKIGVKAVQGHSVSAQDLLVMEKQTVRFKEPNDDLSYAFGVELGAHNSFASFADGWIYYQQVWNMLEQLDRGVRHLLLDFHYLDPDKKASNNSVFVCHESCDITKVLKPGASFIQAERYFQDIKRFLDDNKQAVISVDIENYTSVEDVVRTIKNVPGLIEYLLTPQDVQVQNQKKSDSFAWPTYGELRKKNKRLIIFDDLEGRGAGTSEYLFSTKKYLIRNAYGTTDLDKASEMRDKDSTDRVNPDWSRLLQISYFGTVSHDFLNYISSQNSEENIMGVYKKILDKGYINNRRPVKYIVLDMVHQGINEVISLINKLNASSAAGLKK